MFFFFFKQKTAYEMRISDWSSDVCSSDPLVVFSNSVFGWIKAGQNSGFGQRYFSVDFSQTNHARVAEAFGLKAWRVEDPSQLRGALAAAIEHGGPTLDRQSTRLNSSH